jgi:uncharacterized protein (TIGR03067 family)
VLQHTVIAARNADAASRFRYILRMKLLSTHVATFACIVCFSLAGQNVNQADQAKLQGEWHMLSGRQNGIDLPDASVKTAKRVCKDDTTTVTINGMMLMTAKFTLDASKEPKTIDYDVTAGPNAGKKQLGIYKIDGENVTFCFAPPAQPRPDAFATNPGDGRTLSTWAKSEEKK